MSLWWVFNTGTKFPLLNFKINNFLIKFYLKKKKHNTEFSPEVCKTCRCKNGIIECFDNCQEQDDTSTLIQVTSLKQRKTRLQKHHHNHKIRNQRILMYLSNPKENLDKNELNSNKLDEKLQTACLYDNKIYQFNSVWSPLKCTQCKCNHNSNVDCYVNECPKLECTEVV